jgi:hypothetical protein
MGILDFRRFLPGVQNRPEDYPGVDSLWRPGATFAPAPDPRQLMAANPNVWATGGGPSGPGTFAVPVGTPDPPKPPPEITPKPVIPGDTNPAGKPPVITTFGGIGTLSPLGTPAVVRPPAEPKPVVEGQPSAYGPGVSQPAVTQAPTTPPLGFGSQVTEKAIDRIQRGVATPIGQPTPDKADAWDEKFKKMISSNDFSGAAKALSGAFGGKKGAPPPVFHVSGPSGGGGGVKDLSGQGAQILSGILKSRKGESELGGEKKRRRAQDRYARLPGER